MAAEILVLRPGLVPYEEAREMQRDLAAQRQRDEIPDVLLLLEHPPVYTRGRRSQPEELPMGVEWYEAQGIEVRDTDRGGLVTYHGPGQLVAYPIVDLGAYGDDVHTYVRGLEQVMIDALGEVGVQAQTMEGLTGVWVPRREDEKNPMRDEIVPSAQDGARKIGSIGLHVSRGVTTHGLAINVNNDLQPFEWIVPCGIEDAAMTSLARELKAEQDLGTFAEVLVSHYARVFERKPVKRTVTEIPARGGPTASGWEVRK